MISLQNICEKFIARIITTNKRESSSLTQFVDTRAYSSILEQINKYLRIRRRNKNKRLRCSEKRLTVRYNRKIRTRYYFIYELDIDLVDQYLKNYGYHTSKLC